jgi:ABC-type phosphate transport system substrate-binding protein
VGVPPACPMEVSALRRVLLPVLVSALAVALLATGAAQVVSADAPFRVIVHPQVKGSQIPRSALTSIFLKQAPRWGDGSAVLPVDQSLRSPVRKVFSNDVLQQGLVEVQVYWQRRMATGTTPPPVKTSDEEIVSFVASTPGAIGYVSSSMPLPDSVREVVVVN